MTSPWFPGDGRDEDDEAFLAELRTCAADRGLVDATPEDTSLHAWENALVVLVAVPRLQDIKAQPTLEVISDLGRGMDLMGGWETDGYLADSYEELDVTGAEPTPRGLGRYTYNWFVEQLRRPVERVDWNTWRGSRSLWRLADHGERIADELWRLPKRPPRDVVRLR